MFDDEKEVCDDCYNCKYYWHNCDDDYMNCEGDETEKCSDYIEYMYSFRSMEGYR